VTDTHGCTEEQPELDDRPKAHRYADQARLIEQMIVDALPEVVGKLVSMAKEGNIAAAKYLIDRIHGRPAKLAAPTVGDISLTDFRRDGRADPLQRKTTDEDRARFAMLSIGDRMSRNQRK